MADVICNIESCGHNIEGICFADEICLSGRTPDADNVVVCKAFWEWPDGERKGE